MTGRPDENLPLAIAHRSGNHLERLQPAVAAGADLIEADIWLHRGNLEVRHLKTLGPIPILWDRWRLVSTRTSRLHLEDLLDVWPNGAELMVDIKGNEKAFPDALMKVLEEHLAGRPVTFSGRRWDLLDALKGYPKARYFPSCGSQREVVELLGSWRDFYDAAVLRASIVTPENVEAVRDAGGPVITWPINTIEALDRVVGAGAVGVICDDLEIIRHLAAGRSGEPAGAGDD